MKKKVLIREPEKVYLCVGGIADRIFENTEMVASTGGHTFYI